MKLLPVHISYHNPCVACMGVTLKRVTIGFILAGNVIIILCGAEENEIIISAVSRLEFVNEQNIGTRNNENWNFCASSFTCDLELRFKFILQREYIYAFSDLNKLRHYTYTAVSNVSDIFNIYLTTRCCRLKHVMLLQPYPNPYTMYI